MSGILYAYETFKYDIETAMGVPGDLWRGDPNQIKEAKLIIFTGGADINPNLYGEPNLYSYYSPERDRTEVELFNLIKRKDKKILGICRGHQLINALMGGTLYQDLTKQLGMPHSGRHRITKTKENTILDFDSVNSLHHQGIKRSFTKEGVTSIYNGVVESIETDDIISVQFHPEWMSDTTEFFNKILKWAKIDV
jgi:putative glutamine amidotransferase